MKSLCHCDSTPFNSNVHNWWKWEKKIVELIEYQCTIQSDGNEMCCSDDEDALPFWLDMIDQPNALKKYHMNSHEKQYDVVCEVSMLWWMN